MLNMICPKKNALSEFKPTPKIPKNLFEILQKANNEAQELQKDKKIQDGQRLAEWIESSIANLPVEMQEKAKATAKAARVDGMPERCLISTDTAEKMPYIKSLPCTVLEDGNLPTNTILFLWDSNIPDFSGVGNYVI